MCSNQYNRHIQLHELKAKSGRTRTASTAGGDCGPSSSGVEVEYSCDFEGVPVLHGFLQHTLNRLYAQHTTNDYGPDDGPYRGVVFSTTDHPPSIETGEEATAWRNVCAAINNFAVRYDAGDFPGITHFREGPPLAQPLDPNFDVANAQLLVDARRRAQRAEHELAALRADVARCPVATVPGTAAFAALTAGAGSGAGARAGAGSGAGARAAGARAAF